MGNENFSPFWIFADYTTPHRRDPGANYKIVQVADTKKQNSIFFSKKIE